MEQELVPWNITEVIDDYDWETGQTKVKNQTNATTEATTYNGWTNYQTSVVKDWLDNDAATVELQSELLKRAMAYVNHGKWLVVELQSELLTDLLEEWVKDNCPYDDLLLGMPQWMRSAIDEVNFSEIAEHIIEDANRTNF